MKSLLDGDKLCSSCRERKPSKDFHKDSSSKRGVVYYCKKCANSKSREWHKVNMAVGAPGWERRRKAYRDYHYKRTYGVSLEYVENLLLEQEGKCNICGVTLQLFKSGHLHLDHCHETKRIRGILCTNCNRGLGHFQDSVDNLTKAIEYLQK